MAYDADVQIKIDADTQNAQSALSGLQKTMDSAFKSPQESIKKMGVQAESLQNRIAKLSAKMQNLSNQKIYTEEYLKTARDVEKYQIELDKLNTKREALHKQKGTLAGLKLNELLPEIDKAENKIDELKSKMQSMRESGTAWKMTGADTPEYAEMQSRMSVLLHQADILNQSFSNKARITPLLNDLKEANTHTSRLVTLSKRLLSLLKSVGAAYAKIFKVAGSALKNKIVSSNNESAKSFKHVLKQALKYGLGIRSLFLLYKKLRQYAKEAFKDMAIQYPEINAQLSDLVATFSQMTHSIATAFQPLLSVVLPVLNAIMNAAIAAANAIGSFFAALTGQGFIYKAIKQQKNFAGAVGGTGSAAKEAKEELAEYDKLLVIDQDKGGGGGGGGGAGAGDTTFFEKSALIDGASNFAQMIKDAWKTADFTDVGELLGEKLTNALKSIPWPKIQEVAGKVGKSIATLLNGLISPELFSELGNTIAQVLNTPIEATRRFLENFHWDNLGKSLATGLDRFVNEIHLEQFGKNIHDAITGIVEMADNFFDTAFANGTFTKLGKKFATALNNIFTTDALGGVGRSLGNIINSISETIGTLFKEFNWREAGKSLIEGLNEFIRTINWGNVASTLSEGLKGALNAMASGLKNLDTKALARGILDFIEGVDWLGIGGSVVELLLSAIGTAVKGVLSLGSEIISDVTGWFEEIGEAGWDGFWKGLWGVVTDIATWIADKLNEYIVQPIKDFFGIASPSKLMEELGGYVMEGFLNGLTAFWTQIEEWVLGAVQWIEEKFGGVSGVIEAALGVNTATSEVGNTVVDIAKKEQQRQENSKKAKEEADKRGVSTWEVIGDRTGNFERKNVADIEKSAKHAFEALEKVKESFAELPKSSKKAYNGVTKAFSDSASWAQNTADGISKGFDKMPNEVETKFKGAYTKSTDEFKAINQWARNIERDTVTGFNNLPSDVEQKYRSANKQGRAQFDGATDWAKTVVSKVDLGFTGLPSQVQARYKKAYTDGISEFADSMQWAQGRSDAIGIGFNGLAGLVQARFRDSYSKGTAEFNNSTNWARGVATNINNGLSGLPSAIQNKFKQGYTGAQTESNNFVGWLNKQNFTANFKISMPSQNWLQGQWNTLASVWQDRDAEFTVNAKSNFDSLGKLTGFVNAINNAIDQTNYRLLQLKKYHFISNVQTLSHISMPKLAKGGVIPPNQRFIAMLGDQTQGTNIETPLSTMVEAFEMALANGAGAGASTVNINIDGRQVAQVVWDANERRYKQTGRS